MKDDPKLRQALQAWQVSPSAAPDFNTSVWRRVAAEEDHGFAGIWTLLGDWLLVQLPRPAYASALLCAAIAIGFTTASLQASHARANYRAEHARQYLNSIDPLAMMENLPR
ncbi:MAG TPA: hypothetical protein VNV14_07450 [Opitutaceae bacterium]|jgi:hypothetical protein|nr:hypothetical protein [Opitutaceae bacterium]